MYCTCLPSILFSSKSCIVFPALFQVESSVLLTQSPFILNDTIESNILFGLPMERAHYQRVVDSCALLHDFNLLQDGDQTRAGNKVTYNKCLKITANTNLVLNSGEQSQWWAAAAVRQPFPSFLNIECTHCINSDEIGNIYAAELHWREFCTGRVTFTSWIPPSLPWIRRLGKRFSWRPLVGMGFFKIKQESSQPRVLTDWRKWTKFMSSPLGKSSRAELIQKYVNGRWGKYVLFK